jgi:glyoxylase-like metal-dependent hydrolase (beta-lactamase superfamily II)
MVEKIVVGYLNTNAYLYSVWKKECVIIDPGGDTKHILQQMVKKNLTPKMIVLTHGHLDHILAAGEIRDHFLEKGLELPIAIHTLDKHYLGKSAIQAHSQSLSMFEFDMAFKIREQIEKLPEATVELKEGDTILDSDLTVLHTPGHTRGSICLYSESAATLLSGDSLFFGSIGRTDMQGGSEPDLMKSIKEKLFILPDVTRVFTGHGRDTNIEREKKHNSFVQ